MSKVAGVVEQVDSIERTVKGKPKRVYSFKVDGHWYRTNFEKHNLDTGMDVEFTFTEDRWGKNVVPSDIKILGAATAIPALRDVTPVRRAASFPIGLLDGQRSIVRQSSFKAAVELFGHMKAPETVVGPEAAVSTVLWLAAQLETYACGDAEVAATEAEEADESK